ncbi:MAG: hypothetical protein ACHQ4G_04880 [Opitutales bacterium]
MKMSLVQVLSGVWGATVFALVGCTTNQLMSPVTRALGVPPESELAKCRMALQRLQARLEASKVRMEPVMFASGGDGRWQGGVRQWRTDLAEAIVREARTRTKAALAVANTGPQVTFPEKMYHNQLAYLFARAEIYSRWVKSTRPTEDYVLIVEIFEGSGKREGAIQVYVFDAQGQVAICRLTRFPGGPPGIEKAPVKPAVNILFETLHTDARVAWPPYGWG